MASIAALIGWSYNGAMATSDGSPKSPDGGGGRFLTTRWSCVSAAGDKHTTESRRALGELCECYWAPLYAFLRREGMQVAAAQDLAQDFFAHLLDGHVLSYADRQRGRFRSFLLTALKQFRARQARDAAAQKRGGGRAILSFDYESEERGYHWEPADNATPEMIFDRRWAAALIARVIARLKEEYTKRRKGQLFEHLQVFLREAEPSVTYEEIARQLSTSEGGVRVAVHRLRRRCGELVREEVAQTVATSDEVDDEIAYLVRLFGQLPGEGGGGTWKIS
jgi:RNA polymerase sigma factor (sigma-70 family)